ncbi:colicin-E1 domain protein, partial [Escherichia coli]|nr:colicin-E1 domain protein [Escherichia coli]
LRHNASRTPSATELAHANNAAMQAEAERLRLAKAEEKRLAALSEEAKAVEIAQKKLSAAQSEVVKMDGEIKTL